MHVLGTILSVIGVVALVVACVMSLRRMQKLQDFNFKQKHPQEYKKLKANITSFIVMGVGVFGFILGFILLNFF